MIRKRWIGTIAGLMTAVALVACRGRGRQESTPGEARRAPQPGGMMGGGMMSGMMRGAADTAAAPHPAAVTASAPGCPSVSQQLVDDGRQLFTGSGNCYACHGSDAKGTTVGPDLRGASWLDVDGSYAAIAELVRRGVPRPKQFPAPMPPRGGAQLDSLQVCAVAAYVHALTH